MPFDATPQTETIVYTGAAKLVDDALVLLGPNGEHWVRGTYHAMKFGDHMQLEHQFCLVGALRYADRMFAPVNRKRSPAYHRAMTFVRGLIYQTPTEWNDRLRSYGFPSVRAALIRVRDHLHAEDIKNLTRCP